MKSLIALLLAVLIICSSAVSQTNDTWRSVRTNHLFVIGNADAEKLRQVAAWLELFHSAFAHLVSRNVIDSSVPTTVIIFRDDGSFTPFKPRYQGKPVNVAGFFQPGNDVNYIALSLDATGRDPFSIAFHEYVHVHLRDNVPGAPVWLNEGLAELYGSLQFSGNDALIGAPLPYIHLLRQQELLPLKTLFSIGHSSPHYNEQDKTGIFYGQSWALVHYLMLGDRGRQEQFRRFLQLVSSGNDAEKAIENAFGISLPTLEEDLRNYLRRGNLTAQRIANVDAQNYASYTATQRSSLTEGEANYYLGDLLLHQGRYAEARNYLTRATKLAPDFALAHYQLALLNFITNQDLDEAVALAERAHKLAPSNNDYSNLLEHLKLKRGDPSATTQAQESLKTAVSGRPVQTGSSTMLSGTGGSVAINDGQSIDSSGALPNIDELLKKYVEVIGGAAAINAVKSRVVKGTLDVVGISRGGIFETYTLAPDKALSILQAQPIGTVKAGYNGRIGWTQTPTGLRVLKGAELAAIKSDADFYGLLNLQKTYANITLQGKSKIGYRDVYVIDLRQEGLPADRLYLDAQSYLPVRMNSKRMQLNVSTPVEIYFDDWREVEGIKFPYLMTLSYGKVTLTVAVKEIQSNVPVDAKIFERPL
jgi:tetratricopeptide (TPR) repeat protein